MEEDEQERKVLHQESHKESWLFKMLLSKAFYGLMIWGNAIYHYISPEESQLL